eukprot:CAMPEP_0172669446 /NCGR_PEP_ID=MMETSP1074-20121228/9686_1 /TAXON_ID=2916 /ORGANISM="Ceratium fusus, Strain PA161109" /LENGTH=47 /DNA_ID= /DNA_START= /DNA_END= /DNA_ORIENTATION=
MTPAQLKTSLHKAGLEEPQLTLDVVVAPEEAPLRCSEFWRSDFSTPL